MSAAARELGEKAIASVLYLDVEHPSKLSEEQKQAVSALATISAGWRAARRETAQISQVVII